MMNKWLNNQTHTLSIFWTVVDYFRARPSNQKQFLLAIITCITFIFHFTAQAADTNQSKKIVRILFIQLGSRGLVQSIQQHLGKDFDVQITRVPMDKQNNPFNVTSDGFHIGNSRPTANEKFQYPPIANNLSWFDQFDPQKVTAQALNEVLPDILVISGHAIAGLGWHSDEMDPGENYYQQSFYLAGFVHTLRSHPGARNLFKNIKMVMLGGCNSLVNFEPHYTNGAFLNSKQIAAIYNYKSLNTNHSGISYVIGNATTFNTLDFYRRRLTRLYPLDFTLDPYQERCTLRVAGLAPDHCQTLDLNRVLPDYGLFNESHMFNYPYMMKRIFPKAALILGFAGSSDYAPRTKEMLFETLQASLQELNANGAGLSNVLSPIIDKDSKNISRELKKIILQSIRKNWAIQTYRGLGRIGSSITPTFPEVDANGPFADLSGDSKRILQIEAEAPPCAPYENNPYTNCAKLPDNILK